VRDFNEYVGAGVLGGSSHLYELTATSDCTQRWSGASTAAYTAETGAA
jgi:hypothetical protein